MHNKVVFDVTHWNKTGISSQFLVFTNTHNLITLNTLCNSITSPLNFSQFNPNTKAKIRTFKHKQQNVKEPSQFNERIENKIK